MGAALVGPVPGVGRRRPTLRFAVGLLAGGSDEDGIEGAWLGAPRDGDVVSGGFAEAVQLFGSHGVGGLRVAGAGLGACVV